MCKWDNGGVVVDLPEDVAVQRHNRKVSIDECILPQIKELWDAGYNTLGCCCGHGKRPPSVVIDEGHSPEDIDKIAAILEKDDRTWRVSQWQLNTVAKTSGWLPKEDDKI